MSVAGRLPPLGVAAALVTLALALAALAAPLIAPHDPFDLATLDLMNATLPPAWLDGGSAAFVLGTDDQGRDILSAILHGARLSLLVGGAAVALAAVLGVALGLVAGYAGGRIDALVMRVADVQLAFPALLVALLIDGVARSLLPPHRHGDLALYVLIVAIALSDWVSYARTVRSGTRVERGKDYVQAARLIGVHPVAILWRHILPNVLGPVLVIATVQLAMAIVAEATLSFLGVGLPPTTPSLGTLIRVGNEYLFSGEWWMVVFPSLMLSLLVLGVNLVGDGLRDALDPGRG